MFSWPPAVFPNTSSMFSNLFVRASLAQSLCQSLPLAVRGVDSFPQKTTSSRKRFCSLLSQCAVPTNSQRGRTRFLPSCTTQFATSRWPMLWRITTCMPWSSGPYFEMEAQNVPCAPP